MSANTVLTRQAWIGLRKVAAATAGVVVSVTGASGTFLAWERQAEQAIADRFAPVSLAAAPAGTAQLSDHDTSASAARLNDVAVTDGLKPGQSAYFGYVLSLARGEVSQIAIRSEAPASNAKYLSYEVRAVSDATQCRVAWNSGDSLLPKRAVGTDGVGLFPITRGDDLNLCIKVSLASGAPAAHTEALNWQFVAEAMS